MKTKELITKLLELDPDGQLECTVGNCSINYIELLPAYYDGRLQIIEYDKDGRPLSGKYVSNGKKLCISYTTIQECVMENSDFPVDFSELEEVSRKRYSSYIDEFRKKSIELDKEFNRKSKNVST